MVAAFSTTTRRVSTAMVPDLYRRMREEKLLERVVQGDTSLVTFWEIENNSEMFWEATPEGDAAGFWWVRHVYAGAYTFHCCVFRKYRAQAGAMYAKIRRELAELDVTELLFCAAAKHRDLTGFCVSQGFERVTTIEKETGIWVDRLKAL